METCPTATPESSPLLKGGQGQQNNKVGNGVGDRAAAQNANLTSSRISTLDACYEVVKEKLERLREEIRRIRINKQQEQLQQSIHAKRFSIDSTGSSANSQLLMPPTLPGSSVGPHHLSPLALSVSPNRPRYRVGSRTRTFDSQETNHRYNSSSNDETAGDETKPTSARSRRHVASDRSPKAKPRLARQSQVSVLSNDTATTSGKDGSESPPSPKGRPGNAQRNPPHPSRHKSLNLRMSSPQDGASRTRSKPVRENFQRVHSDQNNGVQPSSAKDVSGLSIQITGNDKNPSVNQVFLSSPEPPPSHSQVRSPTVLTSQPPEDPAQKPQADDAPKAPTKRPLLGQIRSAEAPFNRVALHRLSKGETTPTNSPPEETPAPRSRTGSLQHGPAPLVLSTVVLPSHSQLQQVPQLRRPPRSFTVRTNATPEYEFDGSPEASQDTQNKSAKLASLHVPKPHASSVSPQKCLFAPAPTSIDIDAPAGSKTASGGSNIVSKKALTPSVPLLKNELHLLNNINLDAPAVITKPPPQNASLQQAKPPTQHPPRQLFLDANMKSPSIPVISSTSKQGSSHSNTAHADSTPILIGAKSLSNAPGLAKQMAANKLVSAIMGVPSSLLSNDSSSYENLDQTPNSGRGRLPSTSRSVASASSASSAPAPPFPLPSQVASSNTIVSNNPSNVHTNSASTSSSGSDSGHGTQQNLAKVDGGVKMEVQQIEVPTQTTAPSHSYQPVNKRKEQLQQRKSAVLPYEAEHADSKGQHRKSFPLQRNSLDLASPLTVNSFSLDTDSELEGIFGEIEAIDDFETSTTMSDSPSLFTTDSLWPVMIGNNVIAAMRRPRAAGQQSSRKKDPPRVADAAQAALMANRRGSLARPRPTAAKALSANRSTADLSSAKSDISDPPQPLNKIPSRKSPPRIPVQMPDSVKKISKQPRKSPPRVPPVQVPESLYKSSTQPRKSPPPRVPGQVPEGVSKVSSQPRRSPPRGPVQVPDSLHKVNSQARKSPPRVPVQVPENLSKANNQPRKSPPLRVPENLNKANNPPRKSPPNVSVQVPAPSSMGPPVAAAAVPEPPKQVKDEVAMSNLEQKASTINSPKITPSAIASMRRQRSSIMGQQTSLNSQPVSQGQQSSTTGAVAGSGKPSLTGLLYGADAAKVANQHLSQYTFRGNASSGTSGKHPLSKSTLSGAKAVSHSANDSGIVRPLPHGGTLSVNNAPVGSRQNIVPGQVSIASMIFNNPLQMLSNQAKQSQSGSQSESQSTVAAPASPPKNRRHHHHHRHPQRVTSGDDHHRHVSSHKRRSNTFASAPESSQKQVVST